MVGRIFAQTWEVRYGTPVSRELARIGAFRPEAHLGDSNSDVLRPAVGSAGAGRIFLSTIEQRFLRVPILGAVQSTQSVGVRMRTYQCLLLAVGLLAVVPVSESQAAHVTGVAVGGTVTVGSTQYASVTVDIAPDFPDENWINNCFCGQSSVSALVTASFPATGGTLANLCASPAQSGYCDALSTSPGHPFSLVLGQSSVTFYISAVGRVPLASVATLTVKAVNSNYSGTQDAGMSRAVTVQPGLTGANVVWWFGGANPTGWATAVTLTSATGPSSTWGAVSGGHRVTFSTDQGAQTTVMSSGTAFSVTANDIIIQATNSNTNTWAEIAITAKTPHRLIPGSVNTQCDSTWGYVTALNYSVVDQFGALLDPGKSLPLNEQWTSALTKDDATSNWVLSDQASLTTSTSAFNDSIQGERKTKKPLRICDSNSTQAVVHWGQAWQVGTTAIGGGKRVQTNVIQKFLGRASHTNIISPP